MKKVVKEIIVVEGRDDTAAIKRAVDAETIETGGSAISKEILQQIEKAQQIRGVIVFTDPDYPGEKIRKTISSYVSGIKHAFITKEEAAKKDNIGVENASPEIIIKALNKAKTEYFDSPPEIISWERLMDEGLIAGKRSKQRRLVLGEILGIGYANAKQFSKKLKMFQISEEEFSKAIKKIKEKDDKIEEYFK